MSSPKSNIRSFRYSDRVADILESFEGNSLNEKFENLVRFCFDAVPKRQEELKKLDEQVKAKRSLYFDVCSQLQDVQQLMDTLKTLQHYGGIAARKAEQIGKNLDYRGLPKEDVTQKRSSAS